MWVGPYDKDDLSIDLSIYLYMYIYIDIGLHGVPCPNLDVYTSTNFHVIGSGFGGFGVWYQGFDPWEFPKASLTWWGFKNEGSLFGGMAMLSCHIGALETPL